MDRFTFACVLAAVASFSATLGTPATAQTRDCNATLQAWAIDPHMPKGCTCPCPTCTPQCTSFSSGTYFGTPNSFAANMAGSLIGGLLAAAFAPIEVDTSAIDEQRAAAEAAKKQIEALNQKFLAEWQAFQEHAAKARAAGKARAESEGQDLLDRLHETSATSPVPTPASTPEPTPIAGLKGFKWETPPADGPEFAPLSRATFDTSGLQDWQRALCAAYFSQMALATVDKDPARARYLNEQGERAMRGQPVVVACSFPRIQAIPSPGRPEPSGEGPGPSLAVSMKALELVRARAAQLQDIEARLQDLRAERSRAEAARQQGEAAVAQAQAARAQVRPDDTANLAEAERRLAEAQRERDEATRTLDSVTQEITDIETQKESIRHELEAVQRQLQAASVG